MTTLKLYISKKIKENIVIICIMLFSFFLLSARIVITKTGYYLFLIWNIILAIVPYLITMYLSDKQKLNKITLLFSFCIWLLFLPNAPYIITDLYHLRLSSYNLIWLDTLVIASFAISGVFLFYYSLNEMLKLITKRFNFKYEKLLAISICFLSAFGIYLGRFLRFNSWEILSNPKQLLSDCFSIILHPSTHSDAWYFTVFFGLFLMLGYYIFNQFNKEPNK